MRMVQYPSGVWHCLVCHEEEKVQKDHAMGGTRMLVGPAPAGEESHPHCALCGQVRMRMVRYPAGDWRCLECHEAAR